MAQNYCYVDSSGTAEDTNLQLFALHQAAKYWNCLVNERENKNPEDVEHHKEKLVFILSALGLSLFQLLGQNADSLPLDRIDTPRKLFNAMIMRISLPDLERGKLEKDFEEFLNFYDGVRHFGVNQNDSRHGLVSNLDERKLETFIQTVVAVWDFTIKNFVDKNNLPFTSISRTVEFKTLP